MDLGRAVLFAGSALLLISLFTNWYDAGLAGSGVTGWQVFESLDLLLAALAVGGMVVAVRPDLLAPWTHFAIPGVAIFVVAVQLIDAPPVARDASLAAGAWVALAGAFLMAAGAALSLAAISVTVQVRERDLRRRVAAVDRRGEDLEADEAEDLDADPPSRSLFGSGLSGGARSEAADLERTQPLTGLPDDEDRPERP
jgi:hypothetical protein